ncbi:MAG: hypothetical protein GY856_11945 [bacterium]|nr:hypothetical protein [bacterium]
MSIGKTMTRAVTLTTGERRDLSLEIASRIETIVSAIIGRADSLRFDEVDLRRAGAP